MKSQIQNAFFSFGNLFSVLVPGFVAAFALETSGYLELVIPKIDAATDSTEYWFYFLVISYFLGHYAQLVASLLDTTYDNIYEKRKRRRGDKLHEAAKKLKNEILQSRDIDVGTPTFPYVRNYVAIQNEDIDAKLDAIESEYKFFRSMTVIFFITGLLYIGNQSVIIVAVSFLLSIVSYFRYCDMRWKNTKRTYQYFVMYLAQGHD